jgi:hypothetical protein
LRTWSKVRPRVTDRANSGAPQVLLGGSQVVGGGGVLAKAWAPVQAGAQFGAGAASRIDERGQCGEVLAQQVQGAR